VSGRWLVLAGAIVAGLAVALAVMVHGDARPVAPSIDAGVIVKTVSPHAVLAVPTRDASPDAPPPSPLATLRASGSGHESWVGQATALLESVDAIKRTTPECYIAGCAATFTFASDASYRERIAVLTTSDNYRAWTGGKALTVPEGQPDGRVIVTLLLYRPD
jgi:hypothetical protein